jgi:nitronate monooxygenase
LSQTELYDCRRRLCDLGFLREPYLRPDGTTGYRCPAEPVAAYLAKGGLPELAQGRKCLCNALVANIGMPQHLADGTVELALVTLGDDYVNIGRFCHGGRIDFTAADVIRELLA